MSSTRMGNEMILELAGILGADSLNKTAAKKDDGNCDGCGKPSQFCKKDDCGKDDKEDKKDKDDKDDKDEDKKEDKKDDKKEDKKDDDKKEAVMDVLNGLSKLASDLDEMGADDASSAVDDALKIIVQNLKDEQS